MKKFLSAILLVVVGAFPLLASDAPVPTGVAHNEAPFIPLQELQRIIGKDAVVFNWFWKDLGPSRYTPDIKKQVEDDIQTTLAEPGEHPKWYRLPMKAVDVFENPSRPFLHIVLVPASEDTGSLDANLVYVYDTKQKILLYKTYADPSMDYREFQ